MRDWNIIKKKIAISCAVGMTAAVLLGARQEKPVFLNAWWGTLYPQYCYQQIPRDFDSDQVKIRLKFRWIHGL